MLRVGGEPLKKFVAIHDTIKLLSNADAFELFKASRVTNGVGETGAR